MPENDLFTCIYREGKLSYNGTNTGIHRCENAQKTLDFFFLKKYTEQMYLNQNKEKGWRE